MNTIADRFSNQLQFALYENVYKLTSQKFVNKNCKQFLRVTALILDLLKSGVIFFFSFLIFLH